VRDGDQVRRAGEPGLPAGGGHVDHRQPGQQLRRAGAAARGADDHVVEVTQSLGEHPGPRPGGGEGLDAAVQQVRASDHVAEVERESHDPEPTRLTSPTRASTGSAHTHGSSARNIVPSDHDSSPTEPAGIAEAWSPAWAASSTRTAKPGAADTDEPGGTL